MPTLITTGRLPGTPTDKLHSIARSRPFTQQDDVVFPFNAVLESALLELKPSYWRCECTLSDFLDFAKTHVDETGLASKVVAYGPAKTTDDDVWCLDPRGFLTLAVCKETYEILGLVGKPLPWKEHKATYARPTKNGDEACLNYGAKEADAIRRWDSARGPWKTWYHVDDESHPVPGSKRQELARTLRTQENVHIPDMHGDSMISPSSRENDGADEWEENASTLFEWVGMACLGSPRISAGDRCDPYISVYTPPAPSHVGNITTIRWRGLISSAFIQSIIDAISSPNLQSPPSLVAVTAQSIGASPVTYLPADTTKAPILRAPGPEADYTWSLVYAKDDTSAWWTLAESIGGRDRRRG
ncbi:ribonuclease P 40kDa subunit-domain-containing protein [Lenzites betulinus]|nr:ribonuclease P 40kDa subunit-domain-containing protein [Lenzites betulinus]